MSDIYKESVLWAKEYAKDHSFKYRSEIGPERHKYFKTLKEAQEFFDNKAGHKAILEQRQTPDIIEINVSYVKI